MVIDSSEAGTTAVSLSLHYVHQRSTRRWTALVDGTLIAVLQSGIYEFYSMMHADQRSPLGGKAVTNELIKQLSGADIDLQQSSLDHWIIAEGLKRQHCHIAPTCLDSNTALRSRWQLWPAERISAFQMGMHPRLGADSPIARISHRMVRNITSQMISLEEPWDLRTESSVEDCLEQMVELPDGNSIRVHRELMEAPEILFSPAHSGKHWLESTVPASLPEILVDCVMECDVDIHNELLQNIMLSGGNCFLGQRGATEATMPKPRIGMGVESDSHEWIKSSNGKWNKFSPPDTMLCTPFQTRLKHEIGRIEPISYPRGHHRSKVHGKAIDEAFQTVNVIQQPNSDVLSYLGGKSIHNSSANEMLS